MSDKVLESPAQGGRGVCGFPSVAPIPSSGYDTKLQVSNILAMVMMVMVMMVMMVMVMVVVVLLLLLLLTMLDASSLSSSTAPYASFLYYHHCY